MLITSNPILKKKHYFLKYNLSVTSLFKKVSSNFDFSFVAKGPPTTTTIFKKCYFAFDYFT